MRGSRSNESRGLGSGRFQPQDEIGFRAQLVVHVNCRRRLYHRSHSLHDAGFDEQRVAGLDRGMNLKTIDGYEHSRRSALPYRCDAGALSHDFDQEDLAQLALVTQQGVAARNLSPRRGTSSRLVLDDGVDQHERRTVR